ncbi:MAG TPA: hypothetical protein VFV92_05125 [Candidatus Bathyarchaeia archaeon]|nr:hypothetical protein [Candidatus Bathyarchaeia archaeon]
MLDFLNKGYRKPILLLFFLSPLAGEGLSGSTPPLAFLNPLVLFLLGSLYGSGALLVRDYARRWKKGWRSLLILGAGYGIIEEGIMVRSFFSPTWKDLGLLASYGRWLGVNWVWAEWLTIFHSIFSITIPIFLVELTFPKARAQVWLSSRSRSFFHGLLVLSIILGFFAFPYDAPILGLAGCVIAVIVLGWVAKKTPNIAPKERNLKVSWRVLVPIGASVPPVFFFFFTSALIPYAIGTMILGALLVFGYERLLTRWAKAGFNDIQRLGLIMGAVSFWGLFFDLILELVGRLGTFILGVGFVAYLVYLRRKMLRLSPNHTLFPLESGRSKLSEPVAR